MKRYAPARGMPSEPGCRPSTFGVRIDPEMLPCCPARLLSSTAGGLRAGRPADAPAAKRATLRTCNWSCVGGQEFVLVGLSADLRTKGNPFSKGLIVRVPHGKQASAYQSHSLGGVDLPIAVVVMPLAG
jgi:hypothetical protein